MKKIIIYLVLVAGAIAADVPGFIKRGEVYQFSISSNPSLGATRVLVIDPAGWLQVKVENAGQLLWINVAAIETVSILESSAPKVAVHHPASASPEQAKARPRLTAAGSTILTNRVTGTTNIGILGQDARWSEYGEYMNEMLEIIQVQWYKILADGRVSPPRRSHVVITFKINSKGETEIVKVEDSDAGKQGVFSCQNAITYPQPYRKWTEQMIAVLGDEQQLTLSFYYQ